MYKVTEERKYVVYAHIAPNGKYYIGLTSQDCRYRWCNGKGYNKQILFFRAINKYGWENFRHEILFHGLTHEQAVQKEREMICKYKSNNPKYGYNNTEGGEGVTGYRHTPEARQKISLAGIGHVISEDGRRRISESMKGNQYTKGYKHTEQTKQKLSIINKGRKMSEESKRKMSEAAKGRKSHTTPHSIETKQKISEKMKNRVVSDETREKLRQKALQQWKRKKEEN